MKIKLQTLLDSQQALAQLNSVDLLGKTAYSVAKNLRIAQREYTSYDETRIKILTRLGTLADGATDFELTPESRVLFSAEIRDVLDSEVDVPILQVPISAFNNTLVKGEILTSLMPHIIFDPTEADAPPANVTPIKPA